MNSYNAVYTSFDGDDMIYIDLMREHAIRLGYIPINPEHALGYHISTVNHCSSKKEVMKDCMALADICDDFWVYTHDPEMKIESLPEGVLIEMLQWIEKTNSSSFQFFFIGTVVEKLSNNKLDEGVVLNISKDDIQQHLDPETYKQELDFLHHVKSRLRPVVYIDIPDKDFKYFDWAREKCYQDDLVPLTPQQVIAPHVYMKHFSLELYYEHCEYLKSLANKVWVIYYGHDEYNHLQEKYDGVDKAVFVCMKTLKVPKYYAPELWSITTKESQEVINSE